MDFNDFQNLTEAYNQVHQLDEASSRDEFTRAAISRSSGRKGGITFEPGPNWDPSANRGKGAHLSSKQKEKQRRKSLRQEELDVFDVVLEFLQVEGYAETLEEAEWMMSNVIDEEAINIILGEEQLNELSNRKMRAYIKKSQKSAETLNKKWDQGTATDREKSKVIGHEEGQRRAYKKLDAKEEFETWVNSLVEEGYDLSEYTWDEMFDIYEAEGSYGQTPKARTAMGKLAIDRMRKPASEYSQRGEKTKKLKAAEKQTRRQDVLSRGLSGGKKSSRPRYSGGRGKMDADERSERRAERAFDLETSYGAGSVTKNPKKLRKQKAMGEIGESFDTYEFVLCHLLEEGYASTEQAADKIILNMSEAWFEDIMELNRVEKETGINTKTGRPTAKGGAKDDKAYTSVKRMMRGMEGTPAGQRKKEPGKKPPKAGEYGGPRSPEEKVKMRRASAQRAANLMHSARD
jgi:hypothetical protein